MQSNKTKCFAIICKKCVPAFSMQKDILTFVLAGKEPSKSHKARFFIILLSISATYVIGDMYSANLTSLLAKPGRGAYHLH